MPADARAWIDTARAAGSRVSIAGDSRGDQYLAHMFPDTDPVVTSFLQRWQTARLDAGDMINALEGEQPGENDQRLQLLVAHHRQFDRQEEQIKAAPRPTREDERRVDEWLEATSDAKFELIREAAKLEPETTTGAAALVTLIELDRAGGQPLDEQMHCDQVGNLMAWTKRQAGEAA